MKKKRNYILLFLLIFLLLFGVTKVYAADNFTKLTCSDSLLGDLDDPNHPAYYLKVALKFIKYGGVLACIAFTVIDFFKTLISSEKDGYQKVIQRSVKRLIYAIIIFFLPYLIENLLDALGIISNGTCGLK